MIQADRTRKARKRGTCPLCRGWILIGDPIAQVKAIADWVHVGCLAKRCEACGYRLPLVDVAAGHSAHAMCRGEPE